MIDKTHQYSSLTPFQVDWNYNQFRRRVKRWVKLPVQNTEADLAAVARHVFQNTSEAAIKKVVGYALLSKRDLSAVGDVASEVRAMLGIETLSKVSVEHIHRAITEYLIPSDQAFKVALIEAEGKEGKPRRRVVPVPALPLDMETTDTASEATGPDLDAPDAPGPCI